MPKKLRLISMRITSFLMLMVMMVSCASDDSSSWKFAYMSDNKDATADSGVNMATVLVGLLKTCKTKGCLLFWLEVI